MPNWCYNSLLVKGETKKINEFKRKAKGKNTDLSLNNFVPMPKELENTSSPARIVSEKEYKKIMKENEKIKNNKDFFRNNAITEETSKKLIKKYGTNNWWDWKIQNWGTKWDVNAKLEKNTKNELVYSFDSAWSPPTDALEKIAQLYPELYFKMDYEEEGMGFKGSIEGQEYLIENCFDI